MTKYLLFIVETPYIHIQGAPLLLLTLNTLNNIFHPDKIHTSPSRKQAAILNRSFLIIWAKS